MILRVRGQPDESTDARGLALGVVLLVLLGVGLAAVAGTTGAEATEDSDPVTVTLEPVEQTTDAGQSVTYDVVVEGAADGISGYDFTVVLSDGDVADFVDWEYEHDPDFPDEEVSDDEAVIAAGMGFNTIDGAEEIVLGTLTVEAREEGDTGLVFSDGTDGVEITDADDEQYDVGTVEDGALTVEGVIENPALSLVPESMTLNESETEGLSFEATDAVDGVSSFEVVFGIEDSEVISLDDVAVPGDDDPMVTHEDDALTIGADPGHDAGDLELASFAVEGLSAGTSNVTVEEVTVTDLDGEEYEPRAITGGSVAVESTEGTISIDVQPATEEIPVDTETTLDLVVDGPGSGIGAYDLSITVNDTDVGVLTDFEQTKEPQFDMSEIAEDGSWIDLEAAMGDNTYDPASEVVIATLTLETGEPGAISVAVDEDASISDNDDVQYEISTFSGGVVSTVEGPPPIVGEDPPQDLNGDGLYRDVNGDGELDIFDVQALFSNMDQINDEHSEHTGSFNFSGGDPDEVTIFDVQALFNQL